KPDCALCYYNIGNSLFARGEYERAIPCWLRTAELDATHPQINYRIAQAYWSDGQFKQSREQFLIELRINPGDIDVIFDFGLFLLECGDVESAKEKFNRTLELDPDFAAALFYLGEIAFNGGDHEQAAELYNQALVKDKNLQGPCYRLAQNALMKGRKAEAGDYLVSEMKLALEDAGALVSMGSMFLEIGDLSYATHCLLRAVEIDWSSADAYYYLGVISALKEEFEDAAELFAHSLDIRNEHVPTLRDSAFVCLKMDNLKEATRRIKKARALGARDPQLKELARKVTLARMKQRTMNLLGRS
ncbi:MAG: tetratricopeptide repeat protein, partial [Planctomycetota bacterium]|nr:tetratricopeptide repeat protein [Planctomycetota bacterium]